MKNYDKDDYLTALLIETVRYAELDRNDLGNDEYSEMIKSLWFLLNPLDLPERPSSVRGSVTDENGNTMSFSAHSHKKEPLTVSYEDVLVYHNMMSGENESAHYIVDRFCPKKII